MKIVRRAIPAEVELHPDPLANRILQARGLRHPDELRLSADALPSPQGLPDIDAAVRRLRQARDEQERILIIGDYDCDGATSTAVAALGLAALGCARPHWHVPNRFRDGYGLSPSVIDQALGNIDASVMPSLILTVDNGVASIEGVAHANALGIDVLITDHHLPGSELPAAVAIVNPTLSASTFTSTALAGVGVVFYVLLALRAALRADGEAACEARLADLLDLVAIGTVCDLVPFDAVNRVLVEQGLRRLRAGRTRPGVEALLRLAGRDPRHLLCSDIGFTLGPRLNAAGRLDDIGHGIRCLLAESDVEAEPLARRLDAFNRERRVIEASMRSVADAQLAEADIVTDASGDDQFALVVHDPGFHEGVIGILAGRLKQQWNRPVVVLTNDGQGRLKGSARSIPGLHFRDVLQAVADRDPDLLVAFGGHAMAAGLTISADSLGRFRSALVREIRRQLDDRPPSRTVHSDGGLDGDERSLDAARLLERLMPWGQGFAAPLFDDEFLVESSRVVGENHLALTLRAGDQRLDAIAFNEAPRWRDGERVHVVYSLEVNRWRDRERLQLRVDKLLSLDEVPNETQKRMQAETAASENRYEA